MRLFVLNSGFSPITPKQEPTDALKESKLVTTKKITHKKIKTQSHNYRFF